MIEVHQHDVATFLTCRRKFYLSFVEGYKLKTQPNYINIGSVFAKSVYYLHKGKDIGFCMAYIEKLQEELAKKATNQSQIEEANTNCVILQAMLNGYEKRFDHSQITEIEPEYRSEFLFPQNKNFKYVCRLDGKAKVDEQNWIMELKTTAQINRNLVKQLPTNFQINSYWISLLKNGYDVTGVWYRFIQKPSIRQKKTETLTQFQKRIMFDYIDRPDHYFYEDTLMFDKNVVKQFEEGLYQVFDDILRCYATNAWYQEGVGFFRGETNCSNCWFLNYCYNPTEETLETYYEKGEEHKFDVKGFQVIGSLRKAYLNKNRR